MTRKNKNNKATPASKGVKALRAELQKLKLSHKQKPRKNTPFSDAGEHLGGMFGFKDLGKGIGGVIGRILGSGDYMTNFDTVQSNALTSQVPAFGGESTIITHREYLKDVYSADSLDGLSTAFNIEAFRLNPTNDEAFPWLSTIAQNFEEYTILGMVFEFKSMSGMSVASPNTSLGSVILATQYDPTKPAFASKQQMENYFFCQSTVPSNSMLHAVECKSGSAPLRSLYTSGGQNIDPRFVDYGVTYLATVGMPGQKINLGELWVSYKIELKKPRLGVLSFNAGSASKSCRFGADDTTPLGSAYIPNGGPAGTLSVTITPTTITINEVAKGNRFSIQIVWYKSTGGVGFTYPTTIYTNGRTVTSQWQNKTVNLMQVFNTTNPGVAAMSFTAEVTGEDDKMVLTFGTAGVIWDAAFCDVLIVALDPTAVI